MGKNFNCWYCDKEKTFKKDESKTEIFIIKQIPVCKSCLEFYYPDIYKRKGF